MTVYSQPIPDAGASFHEEPNRKTGENPVRSRRCEGKLLRIRSTGIHLGRSGDGNEPESEELPALNPAAFHGCEATCAVKDGGGFVWTGSEETDGQRSGRRKHSNRS